MEFLKSVTETIFGGAALIIVMVLGFMLQAIPVLIGIWLLILIFG